MLANRIKSLTKIVSWTDRLENQPDPLSLLNTSKRIRQTLEKGLCNRPYVGCESADHEDHENCAYILHYYGQRPFKCKFPRCNFWRHGFETRSRRQQHERSHENPLKCHVNGCKFGRIGFLSEKMRQRHLKEGHSCHPPQPRFDARDLENDSVEPLLHYLVANDEVDGVRAIFATLSNSENFKTDELRMLASFSASPAMLKVLGKNTSERSRLDCIVKSIQGRNKMTMEYNLLEGSKVLRDEMVLTQIVSTGWLEGLKMWCKSLRDWLSDDSSRPHRNSFEFSIIDLVGNQSIIRDAANHPAGEEAVLFLWRESGLLSYLKDIPTWASRTLRHVARLGSSVSLAAELLNRGANINFQPKMSAGSALHNAARNDSLEAAEMMRFLLFNGADPEATIKMYPNVVKRIGDEKGAQHIHKWVGKSWDELVQETKHIRNNAQGGG